VAELRELITQHLADLCSVPAAELDPDRPLQESGLSSRDALVLAGYLESLLERPLPPTLVWEHPTISGLAAALADRDGWPASAAIQPAQGTGRIAQDAVAIVGLGCRFPGGPAGTLSDPEKFWRFLLDRGDAVGEMPPERWAAFDDGAAATAQALSSVTRWAAVLDDVTGFDAAFFGISPAEATAMDPQQRILLEVSWEALEHAGIAPVSLRGSRTGVFVGIGAAEYAHLTAADLSRVDAWTATGAATSVAAGRISYLLDLRGPSMTVDTACSSSLLAVHLAASSLRSGESDVAVAGGASLQLSPVITMTFDAGGGTSPDGRCRAFDAAANGMVRGEGCGLVVLKRLADARRDGDRVLAVISGTAVNSDGRSNGLAAPSAGAQRDLLAAAYAAAGVSPDQVDYVEAHGTGTPLGDPVEARALGAVLGAGRPAGRPLLIGSVKTNIGHLEAAAGIAGLIKAVLALSRRHIPPGIHFDAPSPHIPLAELGLSVVSQPTAWPDNPWPATAGVSAFGFSGTNVHVVLTAPPGEAGPAREDAAGDSGAARGQAAAGPPSVRPARFVLSDASAERVRDQAARLASWVAGPSAGDGPVDDLAYTLDRRRGRGPHESVVVARDRAELLAGLRALSSGDPHPAVVSGAGGAGGVSDPGPAAGTIIDLPPAPWRHERYWADRVRRPAVTGHPLLGPHVELPGGGHAWRAAAEPGTLRELGIAGQPAGVFPLSAAAEMVVAAACQAWGAATEDVAVTGLRLERLLPLDTGTVLTTTLDEFGPPGQRATVWIHARSVVGAWIAVATADAALASGREAGGGHWAAAPHPGPTAVIPAARLARGQRIPAQVLDRCLAAACASPDEVPVSVALLRVRGYCADGGSCEVTVTADENGTVAAVRLSAGHPVLELSGVRLRRVACAEIPVSYRDKLLERIWQRVDATARASQGTRRWVVLGDHRAAGAPTTISMSALLAAALHAAGHQADVPDYQGSLRHGPAPCGGDLSAAAGVVLLAPRAPLPPSAAAEFVLEATQLASFLAARPGPPPRLWIVTTGALAARPGEAGDPGLAAARGLVRVLALEQPGLRAALVDTDPGADPAAAASALATELIADAGDDEVAWRDGSRLAARIAAPAGKQDGSRPARPGAGAPGDDAGAGPFPRQPVVRPGGGYIITGGYGSLGLVVARWLAERGAGRIVLAGRSGPPEDARGLLSELAGTATDVRMLRGDVAEPGVAEQLVAAAVDGGIPLRGIVHAAGVFADALAGDVTAGDLFRVWLPKAHGAWRLHEAAEGIGLDWFVLFSSAAALLGSPGQLAYATANAWLDAFALWRRARGLPATAIGWGAWSGAGRAGGLAIRGMDPITRGEGVEALEAFLAEDRAVAGIVRIDAAAAAAAYPEIAGLPYFGPLLGAARPDHTAAAPQALQNGGRPGDGARPPGPVSTCSPTVPPADTANNRGSRRPT
jgi:3-oxoacyl-(acyl-carrier-protein) synthase